MAAPSPPGRSVRPMEPAKSTSPLSTVERTPGALVEPVGHRRQAEHDRALGVTRRVQDLDVQAGQAEALAGP